MQFTLCSELCLFCRHLPCLAVDTNTIVCEHRFCPCLLTFHLVLNIFIRFLFFFLHSCSTLFAFSLILDSLTLWPFWLSARWKHGPATIAGRYETVDSVDYDKRKWTKKIKKSQQIDSRKFQFLQISISFFLQSQTSLSFMAVCQAPPEWLGSNARLEKAHLAEIFETVFFFVTSPKFSQNSMRISEGMVEFYAFFQQFLLRILIVFTFHFFR